VPTLVYETTVPAPLERVWAFHDDVNAALPALSQASARVNIESADLPVRVGSRILISARGPFGIAIRWAARIVEHRPPHPTPSGAAASFVDEQESGPFKSWRHEHEFRQLENGTTGLTDRVTYAVRFGVLGRLADRLFVRRQIDAMFRHRHAVLPRLLADPAPPLAPASAPAVHSAL
jgi:ligand-binding SRPBCC domain-containing protein